MIMGQSADKKNMMKPLQDEEEDLELLKIRMKKLRELQRLMIKKALEKQESEEDPEAIVRKYLTDRAIEVLEAAKSQFPKATRQLVRIIASLIKRGEITEPISAEVLYNTFHMAGVPVRLETKIRIYKKGRFIDIREKLKEDD